MKITDTLTGKKKEFQPLGEVVTMYVCGINPYADAHIGHAMSYIIFDVVRRYLEFRGYKVKHVENITDVEDNIINHANRLGITVRELTEKYTQRYFEDMDALSILRPHFTPKATETIPEIIGMTHGLIDKGYGYAVGGNVYFRVRKTGDYGKLSKRSLEQMMAGARIEASEAKEDPMDFVLWKESKPGEPSWDSPWGQGRPGWHIECSAMSIKYLGEQIDIHGGGQDLVFPHHENEIAQSESFTGKKPFVRYWMHNGLLQMGTEKMSKSLGNLITIRDALKKFSADAIRIFILSSYYRTPLTYSDEALEAAQAGAERLLRVVSRDDVTGGKAKGLDGQPYQDRFIEAMDDDFNTPKAIAALFDLANAINQAADSGLSFFSAKVKLLELSRKILGLTFGEESLLRELPSETQSLANSLNEIRMVLRKNKQWQIADKIRDSLSNIGIILEDKRDNTVLIAKRDYHRALTEEDLKILRNLYDEAKNKLKELGIEIEITPGQKVYKRNTKRE
jgi:cysteinyl-tRNA synthetase